ncbi:MAG: YggS family pyridoxal phosphate-dependent enzyme [Fusobacteriaceae bacterium]
MELEIDLLRKNIEEIKKEIKIHSKNPDSVKLVAVTKYFGPEAVEKMLQLGINDVGENKGQAIRDKVIYFNEKGIKDINWHFIGNLQKNKVKYIIDDVALIHSVNSLSLAKEISKRAEKSERCVDILLEINIAGEESKEGYIYEELLKELDSYKNLKNIKIKGLMTMAPYSNDENIVRDVFRKLAVIKDELNKKYFNGELTELSMGMSSDYKIALEEGATIIRVGTKLYSR